MVRSATTSAFERLIDLACIFGGYLAAKRLAEWLALKHLFVIPPDWEIEYSALLLLALLLWTGVSTYTGIYHSHRLERLDFAAGQLLQTILVWGMMTTGGEFLLKLHNVSRQFTLYLIVFSGALIIGRQLMLMIVLRRLRRFGYNRRTALIVGEQRSCERFAQLLNKTFPMGYHVALAPVRGNPESFLDSLEHDLSDADDAFIISGKGSSDAYALRLLKERKSVHIVPGLLDAGLFRQALGDVAGIPFVSLTNGKLNAFQSALKRTADLAVSITLLALLSVPIALILLVIKLTSRGPALFKQIRIGLDGKPFILGKFRTMVADAEEVLRKDPALYEKYVANNFKLPPGADPRVTRIGAILRATSLDELPQLLNVVRGDMSLVGPRPVVPEEIEKYGDYAPLFLSAKPGMTGHWQVSGRSEVQEYAKRVEMDLEYIRDQSLGRDLEILLRTVPAVLLRKGAH
jgi:exopolysaccharide production protein ExoY